MRLPEILIAAGLWSVALAAQSLEVVPVVSSTVERKLRLPGELLPYLKVDLHARVTGFVENVEADRGSVVHKGQLLVRLVAPEMVAQIAEAQARFQAVESQRAEAEARLVAAQSTFERLRAASSTPGAVAGNELVLAEKTVEAARALGKALESSSAAAQASVRALREIEGFLNVAAPFDGVITARFAHPGALVGPAAGAANGPLLTLEQNSRLRLVVAVPETDASSIPLGARVSFLLPAHPGQTFTGVVARSANSMDAKTRTMPVELDVSNSKGLLAPGMYPEVQWPARRSRPSLLVPPTAIVTTTERSFVIRVRDGRAEWVDVARGIPSGALVEVYGSLHAGDTILRRASDEVRHGALIRIAPAAPAK